MLPSETRFAKVESRFKQRTERLQNLALFLRLLEGRCDGDFRKLRTWISFNRQCGYMSVPGILSSG
jgi:hypothetical protein